MKVSLRWLREWVRPRASDAELAQRLTMAGLECEVTALAAALPQVVVGQIRKAEPHPQADRLRICDVDVGNRALLTIVCGAANARAGLKAPVALVGATLPDGTEIRQANLRGVESAGMLCSASELGLAEKSDGLLELDAGAKVGAPVAQHLALEDALLTLELTPNRGDCLSVAGLAREIAAIFGVEAREPARKPVKPASTRKFEVRIDARSDCSRYVGRVVEGLDAAARTPDWMRERLRRSGIRAIHPVVDVTNYVMLERGQPMHAFDCAQVRGTIRVRRAKAGESLKLLHDQTVALTADDLLIADENAPLALAGVMGGAASGVAAGTSDIFLESACFAPERVAATGRRFRLVSDALYRFERGVDPTLQRDALERATELIVAICGGRAGPVTEAGTRTYKAPVVRLRRERLDRLVGHPIPDADVTRALTRLGLGLKRLGKTGWQAQIPGHRYDLRLEVDLVEEVARLYGYDRIPARPYAAPLAPAPVPERRPLEAARERLVARGYQEVVTYSMVEAAPQQRLAPGVRAVPLDHPMADTMAHLRTTLWGGLISAWRYNQQRQQKRVRLFEVGVCFADEQGQVLETERVALLASGPASSEQWGLPARPVDFFDVKGDLEAVLAGARDLRVAAESHPALHPGQSARIWRGERPVGWIGTLHPEVVRAMDLSEAPVLLDLEASALADAGLPRLADPSEYPSSRRDLAVVLKEEVPAGRLLEAVRASGGPLLREAGVFDVYRGAGLPNGFKSVALSLIFQDNSRTLTDQEVDSARQAVAHRLQEELGAGIRGESSGGVDQGGAGRSAL